MGRRLLSFLIFIASIPAASAQITSGGTYGSQGILDLIAHVLGLDVNQPYVVLGLAATTGVMWVSVYIIFKVAISKLDEDLGNNMDQPFAEAVGLASDDDKNILAVLTLLITISIIGTGGFLGIVNGFQSLVILGFSFAILAGLIFIVIGGTGGIIGGTAYATGVSAQVTAEGVEQLSEGLNRIGNLENDVDQQEDDEEDDLDDGDDDEADDEAEYTEEELEQIIEALENAAEDLDDITAEEIRELAEAVENLEEIIDLLDIGG